MIGERRFRAARIAGLDKVPDIILNEPLEARLIENFHSEDIDPLYEAEVYEALHEMGTTVSAIARRVGKSRPYVAKRLRLLRLPSKIERGCSM